LNPHKNAKNPKNIFHPVPQLMSEFERQLKYAAYDPNTIININEKTPAMIPPVVFILVADGVITETTGAGTLFEEELGVDEGVFAAAPLLALLAPLPLFVPSKPSLFNDKDL